MVSVRDPYAARRQAMVREIKAEARETVSWYGGPIDATVLAAMEEVPREMFVSPDLADSAYVNAPLPIGYGQTISQPFIVALMTHLANLHSSAVVLEVGTGSGYQAAVLSQLVKEVYSLEVVEGLAAEAAKRLRSLGYANVHVRSGDGSLGWPEHAPYDAIIVTAATPSIPPAWIEQLGRGGRLVVPLGEPGWGQDLTVVEKDRGGGVHYRRLGPVAFVPLTHGSSSG